MWVTSTTDEARDWALGAAPGESKNGRHEHDGHAAEVAEAE